MMPLLLTDWLFEFSPLQFGAWGFFLVAAYYLWKGLKFGRRISSLSRRATFPLIVIGVGLAAGVFTGFDVTRLVGLLESGVQFGLDVLRWVGVL